MSPLEGDLAQAADRPEVGAGARLESIARFLDFVGESIMRAAEQAREILYTKAEPPTS